MNIYPQHLRERQHVEIIHRRSKRVFSGSTSQEDDYKPTNPHRMGRVGKFFVHGLGLTEQEAAIGLPAAKVPTDLRDGMWLSAIYGAILGAMCVGLVAVAPRIPPIVTVLGAVVIVSVSTAVLHTFYSQPRALLCSLYRRPLLEQEIDALLVDTHDDIARAYLLLVRDIIAQPVPNPHAPSFLAIIKTLGVAVDHAPPSIASPVDTAALRNEAAALTESAERESDQLLSASLERRAKALNRRADANDQFAPLGRRSQAIQAELMAQMDALRDSLAEFHADVFDTAIFTQIADDARRIADEATAVAQAREELDSPGARVSVAVPMEQVNQPTKVKTG